MMQLFVDTSMFFRFFSVVRNLFIDGDVVISKNEIYFLTTSKQVSQQPG